MSFSFSIKKASSVSKPGAFPASAAAAAAVAEKGGGGPPRGPPRGPLKEFREAAEAEEERAQQEAARPRLSSFVQKTGRVQKEKLEALLRENPEALAYDEVYDQISSGSAKEQQQKSQARRLYLGYTEDIKDKIAKDGATADALAAEAGALDLQKGGGAPTAGSPGGPLLPPPRFIGKLLVQAQRRQIEREIIQERQLQKEREREGAPTDEVFVTEAYKQRLEERRRVQQELERQEAMDAARAADKQKDLSSFHAYLLKSGAATRSAAATTPAAAAAAAASPAATAAAAAAAAGTRTATPPGAAISPAASAASTKPEPSLSPAACKPEVSQSPPQRQQQQQQQQHQQQGQQQQQQKGKGEAKKEAAPHLDRSSSTSSRSRSVSSPIDKDAVLPFKRSAAPKTLPVPEKLSPQALAVARARFLARKKQKTEEE